MKTFLKKTLLFLLIVPLVFLIGMLLPPTPLAKEYLLAARPFKDSLLAHVKQPRIIFIAGSSMNFGLDGQVFKDSLHRNPINTGTHGGTGLLFMMDHNLQYVQKGDVVVLVAEYHQMYGNFAQGGEELLRVIFDNAEPSLFFGLRESQFKKTYPYIPRYAMSKFMPSQYFKLKMNPVYSVNSFNEYGDAVAHWGQVYDKPVAAFHNIEGGVFNEEVLEVLVQFDKKVAARGARLYVSFPPYQKASFDNCKKQIDYLYNRLQKTDLTLIGTPERYMVPDDMIFDTPYHLNKKGVDHRTRLLLEDVKAAMKKDGFEQ